MSIYQSPVPQFVDERNNDSRVDKGKDNDCNDE